MKLRYIITVRHGYKDHVYRAEIEIVARFLLKERIFGVENNFSRRVLKDIARLCL